MNFKNKKVLLTGASGFIGCCLLRRLLKEGAQVHIIIRPQAQLWRLKDVLPQLRCYKADLSDAKVLLRILTKVRPSIIYHLAAHGAYSDQDDPEEILTTNIMGGWNLLKAANQVGYSLFVNTGTSSEYGYKQKPMKETDVLEPASYYAVTKAAFTHLCGHVARSDKQPIVTLRPFAVYGPYEEPTRLVPTLMRALYFKEQMNLVSSTTARDFIYVDDMVEAYLRVDQMKRYPGEVFNIGTGRQETIKTLVKTAVEATGCSTEFHWGKMPARRWDTNRWVADIKKAQQCLDWQPRTNLKDGLALMWAWYNKNHRRYEK